MIDRKRYTQWLSGSYDMLKTGAQDMCDRARKLDGDAGIVRLLLRLETFPHKVIRLMIAGILSVMTQSFGEHHLRSFMLDSTRRSRWKSSDIQREGASGLQQP